MWQFWSGIVTNWKDQLLGRGYFHQWPKNDHENYRFMNSWRSVALSDIWKTIGHFLFVIPNEKCHRTASGSLGFLMVTGPVRICLFNASPVLLIYSRLVHSEISTESSRILSRWSGSGGVRVFARREWADTERKGRKNSRDLCSLGRE